MNRTAILVAVAALASSPLAARATDVAYPTSTTSTAPATTSTAPAASPSTSSSSSTSSGAGLPSGWVMNGATVGVGHNVFLGEIGWPGLNLSLLHGVSDKFDIGGNFSFVYGLEGVPEVAPGLKLNAILKLNLANKDKFNLGLRLNPGLALYFPTSDLYYVYFQRYAYHYHNSTTAFGIQFPLEILIGVVPIHALSIHLGISMPMVLFFIPDFSFVFPIQPGFGIEYKLDSSLELTFDSRYGPSIFMVPGGTHTEFAFRAQFGIAYRF